MASFNLAKLILSKKSQFTGFFVFLLLLGCQPTDNSSSNDNHLMQQAQTDASAANTLAAKRLASNELVAALKWLQQAARLGDVAALAHALQLQQRLEGKLATAHWLAQSVATKQLKLSSVSELQQQQLGFWSEPSVVTNPSVLTVAGYTSPNGCAVTIQPVATQLAGVQQWRLLQQQWQQHPQLSQLAVCYSALKHVNSTELNCSEQVATRISCQYQALEPLVAKADISQVVIIAGRGKASYNNGIIQLPDNASLALFQHEFFHLLGFIDEYKLAVSSAEQVCHAELIHPNIVLNNQVEYYLQHWQLKGSELELTAVESCNAVGIQAYRIVAAINPMQFYEAKMPAVYLQLARKVLQQPEQIMPVQYYFAYLARQQQDWPLWQQFMQQASKRGYADAQQALSL
ncbi:hypothetical protein [Rheinheimera salexigens]|uniref:Orphan protein n=2 Tax=Rheinheimera salexigens TaxID=1628148 RepID=A0A1E7Q969_9GAMM|nr:hypothetical protein [Rheinheimera salexigens]OEY70651.1 hypothetical protein BI198_14575 [Rheinheimera salexigens]